MCFSYIIIFSISFGDKHYLLLLFYRWRNQGLENVLIKVQTRQQKPSSYLKRGTFNPGSWLHRWWKREAVWQWKGHWQISSSRKQDGKGHVIEAQRLVTWQKVEPGGNTESREGCAQTRLCLPAPDMYQCPYWLRAWGMQLPVIHRREEEGLCVSFGSPQESDGTKKVG